MTRRHHAHAVEAMREELAARDADELVVADMRLLPLERSGAHARRTHDATHHHQKAQALIKIIDERDDPYVGHLLDARSCLLEGDRDGFARAVGAAIELRIREEVHAMTLELVERLTRLGAPHTEEEG